MVRAGPHDEHRSGARRTTKPSLIELLNRAASKHRDVSGTLADNIAAADIEGLRDFDGRSGVGATLGPVAPRAEEPDVWEGYISGYERGRYAESARYVRAYPAELRVLVDLLADADAQVLVLNAAHDELAPTTNGRFLPDRLQHSTLISLGSGHSLGEQSVEEYGDPIAEWITAATNGCVAADTELASDRATRSSTSPNSLEARRGAGRACTQSLA